MELLLGDCLETFKSVRGLASIVTDPPGGGAFMGLAFDHHKGGRDGWIPYMAARFKVAREATVPGSWGLVWAFGRTAHWTACALDDAGWEVVRPVLHVHGQGWPKADSQLKPAQEVWWLVRWGPVTPLQIDRCRVRRSWAERPASWFESGHSAKPEIKKIGGAPPGQGININEGGSWPTDLVLSHASCCKCVGSRTVKGSAPASGPTLTGPSEPRTRGRMNGVERTPSYGEEQEIPAWECLAACECGLASLAPAGGAPSACPGCSAERWWACPVAEMDGQSGASASSDQVRNNKAPNKVYGEYTEHITSGFADSGGASRFFPTFHYDAKASKAERQAGCEGLLWVRDKQAGIGWRRVTREEYDRSPDRERAQGNVHATIKPIGCGAEDGFMRWAVRLVTPPGGKVGDPWAGSGSTLVAAQIEGHDAVGGDADPGAVDIARARLAFWTQAKHRQVYQEAETLKAAERERERQEAASRPVPPEALGPLFARR